MSLRLLITVVALVVHASCLVPSRASGAGVAAPSVAAGFPVGRRQAISSAFSAAAILIGGKSVNAYDAIPQVEPDFAAMEKLRTERLSKSTKKTQELQEKLTALQATKDAKSFIAAADDMALWVIGEGAVPEGIKVKIFVSDLKDAFEALPKKSFACEMTRTNKGVCYTPGKDVELAFDALLRELRTYSKIQLGDYRKVEFNAF